MHYCGDDVISLAFQEIICPTEMRHQITAATSSVSVELLVFSLCLLEVDIKDPFPKDAVPPVWLLLSG